MEHFDVLIPGSGLAGQSVALKLADQYKVALVTKRTLMESASAYAQGGIAAVLDDADSIEAHVRDTLVAGAGLCNPKAVRFVVERGKKAIDWLIAQGVPFSRDERGQYHLTREGGHPQRRIIHAADATGAAVQQTLTAKVKAHPNIQVFEHHIAIDLITGAKIGRPELGASALMSSTGRPDTCAPSPPGTRCSPPAARARSTSIRPTRTLPRAMASPWPGVPAAAWQTWSSSSSIPPASITRTPVFPHQRGGARRRRHLRLPNGERFMPKHDPRAELAPRDIGARHRL